MSVYDEYIKTKGPEDEGQKDGVSPSKDAAEPNA